MVPAASGREDGGLGDRRVDLPRNGPPDPEGNSLKPHLRQCWVIPPKHGSWLNVAGSELSVLTRQCLDRRIPALETSTRETKASDQRRNAKARGVDWRFTTRDASMKLKHLYPQHKE